MDEGFNSSPGSDLALDRLLGKHQRLIDGSAQAGHVPDRNHCVRRHVGRGN
jgi:hypothetical protein